uniref:Uncharacterized protein n=1 Tax=Dunaliella tertiolecta TaxID=3047 RepID=A0A7S3QWL3_DUNTE
MDVVRASDDEEQHLEGVEQQQEQEHDIDNSPGIGHLSGGFLPQSHSSVSLDPQQHALHAGDQTPTPACDAPSMLVLQRQLQQQPASCQSEVLQQVHPQQQHYQQHCVHHHQQHHIHNQHHSLLQQTHQHQSHHPHPHQHQ